MRALIIDRYGDPQRVLRVGEIVLPALKRGQVLVQVAAAPVHPADIAFVNGWYGIKRPTPTVPGLEGSGTVVEANAGPYGRWLAGKRVAFTAPADGTGTWAEFTPCSATSCVPLPDGLETTAGAMLLANPLTAVSFIAIARQGRHRAFIQTAAASALGQMVSRYARERGIAVINIVRRKPQAEAMSAAGETHVLCSSDDGFAESLKALADQLKATLAFDAIGGQMVATLATAMPHGGKVIQYGGLSGEAGHVEIADLLFHGKSLEGYWVPLYLDKAGVLRRLAMAATVRRHASTIFASKVLEKVPFEHFAAALRLQRERASEGKVLLVP